jgi:hypothetical protein
MKIPKYWAKSSQSAQQPGRRPYRVVIWQWSDVSVEEAQRKAEDRSDVEIQYRLWERRYEQASRSYAVCRLVKQLEPSQIHPDVAPILALHDRLTGVEADRPLA